MLPLLFNHCQKAYLRLFLALGLGIASFFFTTVRYHFPEESTFTSGNAEVEITSVKMAKTPFGPLWSYKGKLISFFQNDRLVAREIPVLIRIPVENTTPRPKAGFRYRLTARLKLAANGSYILSPNKNEPWKPTEQLNSLAEWRFSAKSAVKEHILGSIKDKHVGAFLSGIATGEIDDRLVSFELGRFGLQHLMAISGLHFSILASLAAMMLEIVVARNMAAFLTLGMMTAYFIFLGASASVARAWIAIMIALGSYFIQRRSSAFNALGIAALLVILWEPLVINEIGFQFSFGITAAILLWFSPCERLLQVIFAKRPLTVAKKMDHWDGHGYCLLYFFRQSAALCLAVNLVALPLTLYHFHKFPLAGFLYNLFFPFLTSLSLIMLAFACLISLFFPWLAGQLHSINENYTKFILNSAFNLPKSFDINWHVADFSSDVLLFYLLAIFVGGLFFQQRKKIQEFFVA